MLLVDRSFIRPGYFGAMGARIIGGSDLTATPPEGVIQVVIDRTLAGRFYPGADAVSATLMVGSTELRVVGIVDHIRHYDLHSDGYSQVYLLNGVGTLFSGLSWWCAHRERRGRSTARSALRCVPATPSWRLPRRSRCRN